VPEQEPPVQRAYELGTRGRQLTAVQLGARWTGAPDPNADRMMVTWVDRRLQKLVEARRKKDKATAAAQ